MSARPPAPASRLRERLAVAGGKPAYVRGMFGRIARVYDLMNRLMTLGLDRRWRAFTGRQIAIGPGQVALDVGTGTGDLAIAGARAGAPDARVVAIDFTPEMLQIGREKVRRLGLADRIEIQQGDGEGLAFAADTFDACCSAFVVRNLANAPQGFAAMLRVAPPAGKVACLEISHPRNARIAAGF